MNEEQRIEGKRLLAKGIDLGQKLDDWRDRQHHLLDECERAMKAQDWERTEECLVAMGFKK